MSGFKEEWDLPTESRRDTYMYVGPFKGARERSQLDKYEVYLQKEHSVRSTYCAVSISYHNSNSALWKKTALRHTLMLEGFIH